MRSQTKNRFHEIFIIKFALRGLLLKLFSPVSFTQEGEWWVLLFVALPLSYEIYIQSHSFFHMKCDISYFYFFVALSSALPEFVMEDEVISNPFGLRWWKWSCLIFIFFKKFHLIILYFDLSLNIVMRLEINCQSIWIKIVGNNISR